MRNLSIKEKVQEGIVGRISMTIIYIHFTSFAYECYKVPLTKTTCTVATGTNIIGHAAVIG